MYIYKIILKFMYINIVYTYATCKLIYKIYITNCKIFNLPEKKEIIKDLCVCISELRKNIQILISD